MTDMDYCVYIKALSLCGNIMKNVHCDYYSVVIEVNVNHFLHVWDNFGCFLNDQQRATPTIRSLFDQTGLQVIAVTRHNGPPDPR